MAYNHRTTVSTFALGGKGIIATTTLPTCASGCHTVITGIRGHGDSLGSSSVLFIAESGYGLGPGFELASGIGQWTDVNYRGSGGQDLTVVGSAAGFLKIQVNSHQIGPGNSPSN